MADTIYELIIDRQLVEDEVHDYFYDRDDWDDSEQGAELRKRVVDEVMGRKDNRHDGTECFATWFTHHRSADMLVSILYDALREYISDIAEGCEEEQCHTHSRS